MKIIYPENIYEINENYDCMLLKTFFEQDYKEVELTLYEDIFLMIRKGEFDYTKNLEYLKQGLSYFGCNRFSSNMKFLSELYIIDVQDCDFLWRISTIKDLYKNVIGITDNIEANFVGFYKEKKKDALKTYKLEKGYLHLLRN